MFPLQGNTTSADIQFGTLVGDDPVLRDGRSTDWIIYQNCVYPFENANRTITITMGHCNISNKEISTFPSL